MGRNSGREAGQVVEGQLCVVKAAMRDAGAVIVLGLVVDVGDASADNGDFDAGAGQGRLGVAEGINAGVVQRKRLKRCAGRLLIAVRNHAESKYAG